MRNIGTPAELRAFMREHNLRNDWHEPDESEVDAECVGFKLDNAFNSPTEEFESDGAWRTPRPEKAIALLVAGDPVAAVNLASLLAMAAQTFDGEDEHDVPPVTDAEIDAALVAFDQYHADCNTARAAASQQTFGHTGASIPSCAPDRREATRRMLAAAYAKSGVIA